MTIRSGLGAQVMLGAETTYGTFITPTRALEFRSEGLDYRRETLESQAIRKGTAMSRTSRWARNDKGGGGPIEFEVSTTAFGLVLKHALGAVVITTPGGATLARLHTHTFGDLDDISLTIQKGIPEQDTATVRPFSFLGCICNAWSMSVGVDELLTFSTTWDAQKMTTSDTLATPSFASGGLFGYQNIAISLGGTGETPTSFTLNCAHNLATERYVVSSTGLKRRPVIAAFRELTGTMTLNFDNMTDVNRFLTGLPGAEYALTFTATHPTMIEAATPFSLIGTMPAVEITGGFPSVGGPDLITMDCAFKVRDNGTLPPLKMEYTTSDTAS